LPLWFKPASDEVFDLRQMEKLEIWVGESDGPTILEIESAALINK
jgi:hypothetical protein